ncbi:MAG TPA: hypothetical protein VFV39_00705 [Limnobacter sp.]|nr:hypothetical protein [Limnobacter sp.]
MRVILFNLYPYRERRNVAKKRRVLAEMAAAFGLGALLCWMVSAEFDARIRNQQTYLQELGQMEADLARRVHEVQQKKDRVTALKRQVNALEAVEAQSMVAGELIAYLDESLPEPVNVNRLLLADGVLYINGHTKAVADLAAWVGQLEVEDTLFSKVDLVFVRTPEINDSVAKKDTQTPDLHVFEIKAILTGGVHGTAT